MGRFTASRVMSQSTNAAAPGPAISYLGSGRHVYHCSNRADGVQFGNRVRINIGYDIPVPSVPPGRQVSLGSARMEWGEWPGQCFTLLIDLKRIVLLPTLKFLMNPVEQRFAFAHC